LKKLTTHIGNRSAGFTLLEVMIALAIIAIALGSVYKMHTQTIFMESRSRFSTIAPILAGSKLAEIENTDYRDRIEDSGSFEDRFAGYNWHFQIEDVPSDQYNSKGPTLKKLSISISSDNGEETFLMTTYRCIYE